MTQVTLALLIIMKKVCLTLLCTIAIIFSYGQSSELVFVRINASSGSNSYNTEIYFNDNASLGFDFGFDAQFFGEVPPFSIYSLLVEDNVGDPYVIQAVNTSDLADVTIPLGVNANQGQPLTIRVATSALPPTTEVYLDDVIANTSTALNSSDYVITPSSPLSGTGRYFLRITDPTLTSTYTYDGSWSPTDPSGITSTANDIEVISGNAIITSSTIVNTITIEPGASLTIDTGELTATTINLQSTSTSYSSLIQRASSNINANAIVYERYVNSNAGGNDLIAAPVSGQSWMDFLNDNDTALLNDGNSDPTAYAFAPFDKSTGDFENLNSNSSYQIPSGTGFRAATNTGESLIFTGNFPDGDNPIDHKISVDITNGGPDFAEWNLVGNPYPSYIDVSGFFNHDLGGGLTNMDILTAIRAGIYAYNGNGYDVINFANVAAYPLMAPGQGFFVSANESFTSTHDLEFTIAMQATGNSDDYITGRNEGLLNFTLEMATENESSNTEIYFNENASLGFDLGYDAALWEDTIPNFSIYSHLVQDNTGVPMTLQTLHSETMLDISIPLGVHANQGEQLTFSIESSSLPESVNIYLDDLVANTSILLNNSDYVVTPSSELSGTGRFFLRTSEDTLSTTDHDLETLNIMALHNIQTIMITGNLQENTSVHLYDVQGRNVLSKKLDATILENRIDTSNLSSGVYVVTLQNSTQKISQKVILR